MILAHVVLAMSLSAAVADQPTIEQAVPVDAAAAPAPPAARQDQKAEAKEPPTPEHTGIRALFHNLGEDIKHLPSLQNAAIAGLGGGLALGAHPWDQTLNQHLQSSATADSWWAPGKYIGDTPEQIAASIGTYAIGRILDQPRTAHMGMDLIQAQTLPELLVEPLKFATHRERPDGSNHQSFPSGHAAITFATATVIERHLGWRRSVLGYAI